MNYYNSIKQELINNEITKRVKDYSKNKSDLTTYYNVGKMLSEAGKHYGEGIIKEYSKRLTEELNKGYSVTNLKYMRSFYEYAKSQPVADQLSWSHYIILLPLKDKEKINYYIKISIQNTLSKRELKQRINSKEYERLDEQTKIKLQTQKEIKVTDLIKNPKVLRNTLNETELTEKLLKKLILEQLDSFMHELGSNFSYIGNEYKIKIGDRYNYIDLLLYNYEYNCFVVIELKVTELKKEHIGQIETYMHYIDKNKKNIYQNNTIGIIVCKKDNHFIMEYCSDPRILSREYKINNIY